MLSNVIISRWVFAFLAALYLLRFVKVPASSDTFDGRRAVVIDGDTIALDENDQTSALRLTRHAGRREND